MTIEAMKLALWVLEDFVDDPRAQKEIDEASAALRQAIAEAEKQEPVAWAQFSEIGNLIDLLEEPCKGYAPLYTHPQPKREWVGLTPEERLVIIDQWHWDEGKTDYLCRLVEEKLKEKNT